MSKETYYGVKRDLLQCPKRPVTVSKETYYNVKRDLLQCQKRPQVQCMVLYTCMSLFPMYFVSCDICADLSDAGKQS